MTVHQIIYLCHTFIIQQHLSQIHPTKMKSKFENPHQTKQKLILKPPNSTPLKPTPHPTKKTNDSKPKISNIFSHCPYKNDSQNIKHFPTQTPQKTTPKTQIFPAHSLKNNYSKNLKTITISPRPKISLILP